MAVKNGHFSTAQTVEEFKVLEISPSGKWVKVQNTYGNKFWKSAADITPVEILEEIEKAPKN